MARAADKRAPNGRDETTHRNDPPVEQTYYERATTADADAATRRARSRGGEMPTETQTSDAANVAEDAILSTEHRDSAGNVARAQDVRERLWAEIVAMFRSGRPTEEQLDEIASVATVALYEVESAHANHAPRDSFHAAKDFAECASLYGYVLGYNRAMQQQTA